LTLNLGQTALHTPAAIVARRPPKVRKIGSPHLLDAASEYLIENRGPKRHIRPTPVRRPHGPAVPPTGAPPLPPFKVAPSRLLADQVPSIGLTSALDLPTDGSHLVKSP
jgi:hypothetical protein